jgi:ABC-type branched-subunit amino acid transport system substrate-binding protein
MSIKILIRLLFGLAAGLAAAQTHADIVVGQSAPLTGIAAGSGEGLVLGTKIYLDHINAEGGINGNKLVLVVKDDGYKVEDTVKNTTEFLADPKVVALTGYYGTDNVLELFKRGVFDNSPMPMVGVTSGARLLREPLNPNVFHVRASYAEEIDAIVRHVANLGTKRIAVFYEENPFGEAGLRAAEDSVKKRNLILVARATYEPHTVDVTNAVKDVIASNPDTVIMISITQATGAFVKAYNAAGGRAFLFNISTANLDGLIKSVGNPALLNGLGISQVLPFPYSATLPVVVEYQALMAKYAKGKPYTYSSMEGFLNAKVLVAALKKAGNNPTRASVKQALENLGELNLGGYPVTFNAGRHVGSKFVDLTVVGRNGALMR